MQRSAEEHFKNPPDDPSAQRVRHCHPDRVQGLVSTTVRWNDLAGGLINSECDLLE